MVGVASMSWHLPGQESLCVKHTNKFMLLVPRSVKIKD